MAVCEFDVVEFDVRSGLAGEGVIGWSGGFNEKNVLAEVRWADAWGSGTSAKEVASVGQCCHWEL
jgi:hypothetical protein